MEFPSVGHHCSVSTCRQLDFLPIKCSHCKDIFCKEHYKPNDHTCRSYTEVSKTVPVCPLCDSPVPVGPNEDIQAKIEKHIDSGCRPIPVVEEKFLSRERCSLKKCKTKGGGSLQLFRCDRCLHRFCLNHRLEMDHFCGDSSKLRAKKEATVSEKSSLAMSSLIPQLPFSSSAASPSHTSRIEYSGLKEARGRLSLAAEAAERRRQRMEDDHRQHRQQTAVVTRSDENAEQLQLWQCSRCTLLNDAKQSACIACEADRRGDASSVACPRCTLLNPSPVASCLACELPLRTRFRQTAVAAR